MWTGTVESIHLASAAQGPMESVAQAAAIPGTGLEGDRYALKLGTFYKPKSGLRTHADRGGGD